MPARWSSAVVPLLARHDGACPQGCRHALEHALITAPEARDPALVARLDAVAGRVLKGDAAMKVARPADAHDLAAGRRPTRRHHRPDAAAARRWTDRASRALDDAARAIRDMQVRGAPLIGVDRRLRRGAGAGRRSVRRGARSGGRDPCWRPGRPRSTCLGARRDARRLLAGLSAAERRRRRLRGEPAQSPRKTSRSTARIGEHGVGADRAGGRRKGRRARRDADPLQRRLARARRLGHGDWRRSTSPRTMRHRRSMSGSTRRGRATRAPR